MNLTTIPLKDARQRFSELVDRAALVRESFVVTKFDKPKAMIVPIPMRLNVRKGDRRQGITALIGLWKDRTDIDNTARWVATRRRQESRRLFHSSSS